jgi:hypothetical protein
MDFFKQQFTYKSILQETFKEFPKTKNKRQISFFSFYLEFAAKVSTATTASTASSESSATSSATTESTTATTATAAKTAIATATTSTPKTTTTATATSESASSTSTTSASTATLKTIITNQMQTTGLGLYDIQKQEPTAFGNASTPLVTTNEPLQWQEFCWINVKLKKTNKQTVGNNTNGNSFATTNKHKRQTLSLTLNDFDFIFSDSFTEKYLNGQKCG